MTATYNDGQTYNNVNYLYDGMDPAARPFTVLLGSMSAADDVSAYVKWDTLQATDNGTNGRGLISMTFERTMAQMTTLTDQAVVRVIDHALHVDIARGLVRSRRPRSVPKHNYVDIIADDVGGLLDDTFIQSDDRPAQTMVERISYLWGAVASPPLDLSDLSNVAAIGGTLPAQSFVGVTLRQAIEATIGQVTGADYYVDATGKLHIFTSESNAAPKDIDADAPSGTEIAPEDLDIDYDSNSYANRVYIQGATPAGSGFFEDTAAIAAVDGMRRVAVVQAADCETSAMATALANMYLGRVSSAKPRGTFSTTKVDGWKAGQNVLVTSAAHNLSAQSFRIARVTSSIVRPGSSMVRKYAVEFGGSRAGGQGVRSEGIGTGQVVSGMLGGGSNNYVTSDGFATTDGTNVRVQIGKLPSGDYGLRVVGPDGATVIIDGTSDVFKIVASGTLTKAFGAVGTGGTSSVLLDGLGDAFTVPLTCIGNTTYDTSLPSVVRYGTLTAPADASGHLLYDAKLLTYVSGGVIGVQLQVDSILSNPGTTGGCSYYVQEQAAI